MEKVLLNFESLTWTGPATCGFHIGPHQEFLFFDLLQNEADVEGLKRDKLFLKNSSREGIDREAFQDLRLFSGRGKSHHFHSTLQLTAPPLYSSV